MRRAALRLITALTLGAAVALPPVEAQPPAPIPRVGVLHPGTPPGPAMPPAIIVEALREGLRDLGYVEGRTIALEYRWAAGKLERLPALAAELVALKVDVLVAVSLPAVRAARDAAGNLPIVVTDLQIDPVAGGLVSSIARPGGNITGLFLDFPGLTGKWLELLREAVPSMRRIAVLWDPEAGSDQVSAIKRAAHALGVELQVVEVPSAGDYDRALASALKARPHGLVQLSSPLARQASNRLAQFASTHRLPAISMFRAFAEAGGLVAYGPNIPVFFRRSATYVDRILKGARAGDLPIEQPTTYELVVNSRAAKTLGLTLPAALLLRADEVLN